MAHISVGPFTVDADILDFGVQVRVKLDFKVLDFSWDAKLSANDPEISFSTGDHAKFSGSITVGIDDATGNLYARARVCHPVYDPPFDIGQECEGFDVSIKVLPAGGLCMLAQGVTKTGLSWFNENYANNVPSCSDIAAFRKYASPEILSALVSLKDVKSGGSSLVDIMAQSLNGNGRDVLDQMTRVPVADLEKVLSGVVTNAKVNSFYPGLAAKFGLTAEEMVGDKPDIAGDPLAFVEELGIEIAGTVGLEVALAGAVAAVVGAIVSVCAATTIAAPLSVAILVGLVIFLAILLVLGIVLIPLLALIGAVVLGLIEFKIIEGAEQRQSLLAG